MTDLFWDPVAGSDGASGTHSGAKVQTVARVNALRNAISGDARILVYASGYTTDQLLAADFFNATLRCYASKLTQIETGTYRMAMLPGYKLLSAGGWFQPDVGTYPNVWAHAITESLGTIMLGEALDNSDPRRLLWYTPISSSQDAENATALAALTAGTTAQMTRSGVPHIYIHDFLSANVGTQATAGKRYVITRASADVGTTWTNGLLYVEGTATARLAGLALSGYGGYTRAAAVVGQGYVLYDEGTDTEIADCDFRNCPWHVVGTNLAGGYNNTVHTYRRVRWEQGQSSYVWVVYCPDGFTGNIFRLYDSYCPAISRLAGSADGQDSSGTEALGGHSTTDVSAAPFAEVTVSGLVSPTTCTLKWSNAVRAGSTISVTDSNIGQCEFPDTTTINVARCHMHKFFPKAGSMTLRNSLVRPTANLQSVSNQVQFSGTNWDVQHCVIDIYGTLQVNNSELVSFTGTPPQTITFKNNIVGLICDSGGAAQQPRLFVTSGTHTLSWNYNSYRLSTGATMCQYAGTNRTFSAFQSATGADANSNALNNTTVASSTTSLLGLNTDYFPLSNATTYVIDKSDGTYSGSDKTGYVFGTRGDRGMFEYTARSGQKVVASQDGLVRSAV